MTTDVLLEPQPDGHVKATLLGWPELSAQGTTDADALMHLRQLLAARLAGARIVPLEDGPDATSHPWLHLAERFRDNPLLDDVAAAIAADRRRREVDGSPAL